MNIDDLIVGFDRALRTLASASTSVRPYPAEQAESADLGEDEMAHAAGLMRVNHSGEICAQALYSGQAMTASNPALKGELDQAAREETEHLAWTERRLEELGARTSLLNPLWYAGSFAMGAIAGLAGDRWNLGFLSETERQVEQHLASHLDRLPAGDAASRAIVAQMKDDEARHADQALAAGARTMPAPARWAMKAAARVMTSTAHHV